MSNEYFGSPCQGDEYSPWTEESWISEPRAKARRAAYLFPSTQEPLFIEKGELTNKTQWQPLVSIFVNYIQEVNPVAVCAIFEDGQRTFSSIDEKLNSLAEAWDRRNSIKSIIDYHHFSLVQIIGVGPQAIPFLLNRLSQGETEWLYALRAIAGTDPVPVDQRNDQEATRRIWLDWASHHANQRTRQALADKVVPTGRVPKYIR